MTQFRDRRETIDAFQDEFWVRCPRCQSRAIVRCTTDDPANWFAPRRVACGQCGFSNTWNSTTISRDWHSATDWYFHYPLWLQTPCCGEILWAYNPRHLDWLEAFVGAKLRSQRPDPQRGWSNRSLAARLPKWIQSRKHRSAILQAIAQLRQSYGADRSSTE